MGKKIDNKIIISELKKMGYILLSEYINTNSHILIKNKDGYMSYTTYSNLKLGRTPDFFAMNNEFYEYNVKLFLSNKDKDIEILKFNYYNHNNKKKVILDLKCSCGNLYRKDVQTLRFKTYCKCNKCAKKKSTENRKKNNLNDFVNMFTDNGYTIKEEIEYPTRTDRILVEDKNGFIGYMSYNSIKRGSQITPFDMRVSREYYLYNVNNYSKLFGYNSNALEILDRDYGLSKNRYIRFKCSCGEEFITTINSFCNDKYRCNKCSKSISVYEHTIKMFLDDNNIKYIQQYKYNNCRDILPLPFDFYLVDYDKLIEVDGEGHYRPTHFNNISKEDAIKTYEKTIEHDKIKNEFCKQNNKSLLRICYLDIQNSENYKSIINTFIED